MIIAICGPDGTGKTTLSYNLAKELNCKRIKFPNESKFSGQRIRELLNFEHFYEPASFQALQIQNMIESMQEVLEAEEKDGGVILDRYYLSTIIYGMVDGLPEEWLLNICSFLPEPDLWIILEGANFKKDQDVFSDPEFQEEIAEKYKNFNKFDNIVRINVDGKCKHEVLEEALKLIKGVE